MRKKLIVYLLLSVISVLAGCDKGVPEMNAQEQQTVQDYINAMAPVCIGRFMMDVPEQMELAYSFLKVNDATISARPMSRQMFERHIAKRQRDMENMPRVKPQYAPFLKNMLREEDMVIFDRNKEATTPDSSRVIEGYRFSDNMMFEVTIEASDLSDERYIKSLKRGRAHDKPGRLHQVRYLLGQLRPLRRGEIPDAPGVCFENGFLALEAEQDMPGHAAWFPIEEVAMRFIDRERRDVYFHITTDSWLSEETTLPDRVSDVRGALRHDDNGAVLRTGEVVLQGIDQAAEMLTAQTSPDAMNEIRENHFYLEANSLKGNRQDPLVTIKFINGRFTAEEDDDKRIDRASLTDAEAAGLWDAVTRTFRPRPGAF